MSPGAVFFLLCVAPALSLLLGWLGLKTLSQNLLGWFLLATGAAYPASALASYAIRKTPLWGIRGKAVHEEKGDLSFWAILPGMAAAFFLPPVEYLWMPAALPRSEAMQWAGLGLALAGVGLGIWARTRIRSQYSGHLQTQAGSHLVTQGPYRCIRHPSYAGFLLVVLGVATGYGSVLGLGAILLLILPGLAYRMKVEEDILVQQFHEEYLDYKSRTKRLIPGIW